MRRLQARHASAGLVLAAVLARAPTAHANPTDGAYGRLDGDLLLSGGLGASVEPGGPGLVACVQALFLSTAGLYVRGTEGFGQPDRAIGRSLAAGVEVRPLFLSRFAADAERGPARFDLWLDSLALQLGSAWWSPPQGPWSKRPALELGAGFALPILPEATGPHLGVHGALRFGDGDLGSADGTRLDGRGTALLLTVSWHGIVDVGLVDVGDAITR